MPRRAKSPRSDSQREEVYEWEHQFFSSRYCTSPDRWFRRTLREICRRYKVPVPKIEVLPRIKSLDGVAGLCWHEKKTLYFREGYRSVMMLCHELAHWVLDCYGYGDVGCHGPKFMGVYLWMLSASYTMPLYMTVPSARAAGLKFRDPHSCAPGKLKRYLEGKK